MNILFLHGDSFCYDSATHFMQCIEKEFERLGWKTEHVICSKEQPVSSLASHYGKQYDIIFSINLALHRLRDADGGFCLNWIQGPVWHYILDHPFYHHDALQCPLEDFHVICLDERHAEFIRKHYPHIRKVICLPLAAEQADRMVPYSERTTEVLFTGTYTDSDLLLRQTLKQPVEQRKLFEKTVQLLFDEPELTQEEAISRLTDSDKLPRLLKENYLIDMYLGACLREELISQFLKKKIPVTVYGHNWEQFLKKCQGIIPQAEQYLRIKGEVPYEELMEIYADAKIAINLLPWFKAGMHDRIPLAMRNGCVCVTDGNSYLEKRFCVGEELYFYSLEDMVGAAELVQELREHPSLAEKTAASGYRCAQKQLCWEQWAETFLEKTLAIQEK